MSNNEGLTDGQMHVALCEMGFDFSIDDSNSIDWSAVCEMAINEGYHWDEEKERWLH